MNLDYVCCPKTKEGLRLIEEKEKKYLVNSRTKSKYLIKNNIGVFLEEKSLKEEEKKYAQIFNAISPIYELVLKLICGFRGKSGKLEEIRKNFSSEIAVKGHEKSVLEVAIGTGTNIKLLPKDAKYYGIDLSYGMLKKCKSNLKKWGIDSELSCGLAEELPYGQKRFDLVFCVNGLMYFTDIRKSIDEMIRVTKTSGRIVIINKRSWQEIDEIIKLIDKSKVKLVKNRNFYDTKLNVIELLKL